MNVPLAALHTRTMDVPGIMQAAQQHRANRLQLAGAEADMARQQQLQEVMPGAVSGDPEAMQRLAGLDFERYTDLTGERREAQAHELEMRERLQRLQGEEREQARNIMETIGRFATGLKNFPEEQRPQVFEQVVAPQLAEMGIDPQQMNIQDLSDATLDMYIAQTDDGLKALMGGGETEQFTVEEGGEKVTYLGDPANPQTWQELARSPRWRPPQSTERGRQIARLQERGIPADRAENIADGIEQIRTDPETGTFYTVDMLSGSARPLKYGDRDVSTAEAMAAEAETSEGRAAGNAASQRMEQLAEGSQRATLWEAVEDVPGVWPSLKEAYSVTFGQIPGLPIDEETVDARSFFRIAQNDLIRSLSINPRFPVAEMERIKEETAIEPRTWDSPDALRTRMRRLDQFLRQRVEREREAANDRSLPRQTRSAAAQAEKDIANFLEVMGVPQDGETDDPFANFTPERIGQAEDVTELAPLIGRTDELSADQKRALESKLDELGY